MRQGRSLADALRRFLVITWALLPGIASAQINMDAYRDYFLVGQFGEVCTMCEVTVLCQSGELPPSTEAVPQGGDFTVYHLQTRTFWSQMSTIWEWFIANFREDGLAAQGHTRPVHVYQVEGGEWPAVKIVEARLLLDPGVLFFGNHNIDRVTREWQKSDSGDPVGYCSRLPLWDALEDITANAPENLS